MKSKIVVLSFGVIVTAVFLLFQSCRKINLATQLGQDIIPIVDNINTFDTSLSVDAYNDLFTILNDSVQLLNNEEHFLGKISNDPLFGNTDARLFLQLKPVLYPHAFERPDSLTIDSVVLVLGHTRSHGDTLQDQTVSVYQLDNTVNFRRDSLYNIRTNSFTYSSNLLGSKTFKPRALKDSVFAFRDTTDYQLRVKLSNTFGQTLLNYDSTVYKSDSLFNLAIKGFALQSTSGNAVMGFDLNSTNTKLAIYYNYPKTGGAGRDTTVTYFKFTGSCANANYVIRDYTGSQLATYLPGTSPDDMVFLQNTPGSFATVKIPALSSLSNRIVHRAELIVEQVYHTTNGTFPAPSFMYLDAYDTTLQKYRTIPFDVTLNNSGQINREAFGMIPLSTLDGSGNPIKVWKFNISRYVQHVLTGTDSLYDLRLSTPYFVKNLYQPQGTTSGTNLNIFVNTSILNGRIMVGGGNHANQKMRLRIIYTKI